MRFSEVNRSILADGTIRILVSIGRNDLVYFGFLLETCEGWCNYTTVDRHICLVQIDVIPDYAGDIDKILGMIRDWEYQ